MKIQIQNISYVDYLSHPDKLKYNYYLRNGEFNALDLFNLGDFMEQNFGFVKDIQYYLNNTGLTWDLFFKEMESKTGINIKEIVKHSIFDLQMARVFLKSEIEKINELENKNLSYKSSQVEIAAGIEEFSNFGAFLQFDKLAGGDITKIESIRNQPYNICFTKLLLEAQRNEFNEKYNKLIQKI